MAIYSLVLSRMLFSAWATLFRPEWTALRRGWVIVGASLFYATDARVASARLRVMGTYHLGQMALAAIAVG